MSALSIEPVKDQDFSATAVLGGSRLTVVLSGTADLNVKQRLDRFLDTVHSEVQRMQLTDVQVDVRELEFMNSSCLKCLVTWICQIQDLAPSQQYHLAFLSSPAMYWQKRSLHALCCLASDLVSVQG